MNEPNPEDQKKIRVAYAMIVPFILAEVVIVVVAFTKSEMDKTFFGIVFGANVILAIIIMFVAGVARRRG